MNKRSVASLLSDGMQLLADMNTAAAASSGELPLPDRRCLAGFVKQLLALHWWTMIFEDQAGISEMMRQLALHVAEGAAHADLMTSAAIVSEKLLRYERATKRAHRAPIHKELRLLWARERNIVAHVIEPYRPSKRDKRRKRMNSFMRAQRSFVSKNSA